MRLTYPLRFENAMSVPFAALPDAQVERVAHILAGAHHCAYRITPLR